MNAPKFAPALLAAALLSPCAGAAAQSDAARARASAETARAAESDAARDGELAEAQAELARAAKKVAELSRTAIPEVAEQLRQAQQQAFRLARRPVIGVVLVPDETAGVRIGGVTPDSAAAKAGLKSGDRIVSVNGSEILGDSAQLRVDNTRLLLSELEEGRPVKIGYVRDGRSTIASVTPRLDDRVFMFNDADNSLAKFAGPVSIRHRKDGAIEIDGSGIEGTLKIDPADVQKQVDQALAEVRRIAPDGKGGFDIRPLAEAFRWNGLNLATVDPQLGRYFGTDKGVLVVSAGEDLPGLQAGDVIRRIDGEEVNSPREAMAALRAKPAESQVKVEFLRDRKNVSAQVKVPKAVPFRIPTPPVPPVPPTPPTPPTPPVAPTPPTPPVPPTAL